MRIRLLCVGTRVPAWVDAGFEHYARRLPHECALHLQALPTARRRGAGGAAPQVRVEGERMLAALPPRAWVVALDQQGSGWDTRTLARRLDAWMGSGHEPVLLVGGPDGLAPSCLRRADERWSLSPMTFPHALVRVLVAEQLYRAWSLLHNHPYHRA